MYFGYSARLTDTPKNFGLALYPGSGFHLTLLYDVMFTLLLLASGALPRNQMRFAMAAGANRHYRVHEIQPRHFCQSAVSAGMARHAITQVLSDVSGRMAAALDAVPKLLPDDFPVGIADAISKGAHSRADITLRAVEDTVNQTSSGNLQRNHLAIRSRIVTRF